MSKQLIGALAAIVLMVAAVTTVVVSRGGDDGDRPALVVNNDVLAHEMPAKDGISRASEMAGYQIRTPTGTGFKLLTIRADQAPGIGGEPSFGWTVTLNYRDANGRLLHITQLESARSMGHAAGSHAREVVTGINGVTATVTQRAGVTSLAWNSDDATYLINYGYPDESYASTAEDWLVAVAKSME